MSVVGDGINIETEVDEELDYVDDAVDQGDISDDEMVTETMEDNNQDSNEKQAEQQLLGNPALRKLFNQLLDERIKQAKKVGETSGSNLLSTLTPQKRVTGGINNQVNVKSPSDTTIYAPAFAVRTEANRGTSQCE